MGAVWGIKLGTDRQQKVDPGTAHQRPTLACEPATDSFKRHCFTFDLTTHYKPISLPPFS